MDIQYKKVIYSLDHRLRSASQQQGRSAVEEKETVELFTVMFQCLQQQSMREVIAPRVQQVCDAMQIAGKGVGDM